MINILRQNQRYIMLVIAVLTIIAFIWLYNPATTKELGTNHVATMYGRQLTRADLEREAKSFQLAMQLGQLDLITKLGGSFGDQNQMLQSFIWNIRVLQHEAIRLGAVPTDAQIEARIMAIPAFQTNGQFNPDLYTKFALERLGPLGFTREQIEKIIRDTLSLETIEKLVTSPTTVSESAIREAARVYEKEDLQVINFDAQSVLSEVKVTDEEVQSFYNRSKPVAPETRSVEYVAFSVPAPEGASSDDGQLEEEEVPKVQKLADEASAFAEKVAAPGASFEALAKEANLTIQKSGEFDRNGVPKQGTQGPGVSPSLGAQAFLLTKENPVSDVVQNGLREFVVARLVNVTPSRELPLEEVKSEIEQQVKLANATQMLKERASASLTKVRDEMAAGKSFDQAVKDNGLTARAITGVTPMETMMGSPDMPYVRLSIGMKPGEITGFVPGPGGGFAVYVQNRSDLTPEELVQRKVAATIDIQRSIDMLMFNSWLQQGLEESKLTFPGSQQ